MIIVVDDEQLFDAPLVKQPSRLVLADAGTHGRQIIGGHQLAHRLARIVGETHIAVGQDADKPATRFDDGNARNPMLRHKRFRLGQRRVGSDGNRVDDHTALEPLDLPHGSRLFLDRQIAVEDANAADLCHQDRHVGLGHRVHRRRQDGNVEADLTGQLRRQIGIRRQYVRGAGHQQHIVKGQAGDDFHGSPLSAARRCPCPA